MRLGDWVGGKKKRGKKGERGRDGEREKGERETVKESERERGGGEGERKRLVRKKPGWSFTFIYRCV